MPIAHALWKALLLLAPAAVAAAAALFLAWPGSYGKPAVPEHQVDFMQRAVRNELELAALVDVTSFVEGDENLPLLRWAAGWKMRGTELERA